MTGLPALEIPCKTCKGEGRVHDTEIDGGNAECWTCNGSGFVPTETGAQILALLRHNSRVTVSAELCFAGK